MSDEAAIGPDRPSGPVTETFRLTIGPDGSCRIDFLAGDELTVTASVLLHADLADTLANFISDRRATWEKARNDSLKARH